MRACPCVCVCVCADTFPSIAYRGKSFFSNILFSDFHLMHFLKSYFMLSYVWFKALFLRTLLNKMSVCALVHVCVCVKVCVCARLQAEGGFGPLHSAFGCIPYLQNKISKNQHTHAHSRTPSLFYFWEDELCVCWSLAERGKRSTGLEPNPQRKQCLSVNYHVIPTPNLSMATASIPLNLSLFPCVCVCVCVLVSLTISRNDAGDGLKLRITAACCAARTRGVISRMTGGHICGRMCAPHIVHDPALVNPV